MVRKSSFKKRSRSLKKTGKNRFKKKKGGMSKKKALARMGRALRPYVQLGPLGLAKKHGQPRKYVDEKRGYSINTVQDACEYGVITSPGCYGSFNNILSASGQEGALGSSTNEHIDHHVYNHTVSIHLRNCGNHVAFMDLYECSFRNNHNIDTTTNTSTACSIFAMNQLNQGFESLAASGEFGAAGTIGQYNEGDTNMYAYMKTLTPFNSFNFVKQFKIIRTTKVRLKPGDDYWYKIRVPAHTYSAASWLRGDDLQRVEAMAGISKMLMYRCHGALGKGNADDTKTGWMIADLAYEILHKATVCQVAERDRQLAVSYTADDLTAVTLEAASAHQMADEGQ